LILYVLFILLGAASYGLMSPFVKMAMADGWNVRPLTFMQVICGTVLLWIIFLARHRFRPQLNFKPMVWIWLILIGISGLSLTTILFNNALDRLDASLSIVLLFQFTWITILLECIRMKRWPKRHEWISVMLVLAGTLLAARLAEDGLGRMDPAGIVLGLLSAVSYSLFFFLSSYLPPDLDPLAKSSVMAAVSLLFILSVQGTGLGPEAGFGSIPLVAWGILLGLLGTALPTVFMNAGIPKVGAGLAALLGSFELPIAVLAANLLLGEPLSWLQGAGILLILGGILSANGRETASAASGPGSGE
jgi:drug/metabolite transporter (DMT)-like permease